MIIKQGDLFTTELRAIGHGVNLDGVMGAGVARLVREKYTAVYDSYKYECDRKMLPPGGVVIYWHGDKLVVNMATQVHPGPDAQLLLVRLAAENAASWLKWRWDEHKMAIPKIGCGIGGLNWDDVQPILEQVEMNYDFEFEVWEL